VSVRKHAPPASQSLPQGVPASAPDRPPPLSLAAAGLTALDGLLTLACFGLFVWDARAATPIIQGAAPLLGLAGVAGVVVGGVILVKNKRSHREMKGSVWANPAIVVGLLLMTAAVFLPLLSALAMLVDESSRG